MIEDLTMLANHPVVDAGTETQAEADKAAASETMPPAKHTRGHEATDAEDADAQTTDAEEDADARLARRGQDPPEQEKTGQEDS